MPSTRKLVAIVAALVAASGIALAQTMPDEHSMGPDHQQMINPGNTRWVQARCRR